MASTPGVVAANNKSAEEEEVEKEI